MRSVRYLNAMLTILAILLALQLWTTWTLSGPGAAPAHAGVVTSTSGGGAGVTGGAGSGGSGGGIPDAGAQRRDMIDLLKLNNQKLDQLLDLLRSGQARFRVEAAAAEKN